MDNYKCLQVNCILNDIPDDQTVIVNCGISDKAESLGIHYDPDNPGGTFLSEAKGDNHIEAYRFDDIINRYGISVGELKYIWVDVEGFEGAFLKGAENVLRDANIPLMTEFSPSMLKRAGTDELFFDTVEDLFSSYIIMQDKHGVVHPIADLRNLAEQSSTLLVDLFLIK